MAQQLINLGVVPNNHAGDPPRTAGTKINQNFTELYTNVPAATAAANAATAAVALLQPAVTQNTADIVTADTNITNNASAITALQATVGGLGAGSNNVYASVQTGIFVNGTDSRVGVQNAFNTYAGTGRTLIIDGPVTLNISDYSKPIFIPSNLRVAFQGTGKFIVNSIATNTFILSNVVDTILDNWVVEYRASFGSACINSQFGPMLNVPFNTHNITLTNHLITTYSAGVSGNLFTGGATPVWSGPTVYAAVFNIRGATSGLRVRNLIVRAPKGSTADAFPLIVAYIAADWIPGQVIGTGTPQNVSTVTTPSDLVFDSPTLDGFCMGFVGTADITVNNPRFMRYSDLQDGTSGIVTFSASLSSGAGTATLSAPWPYATGTYAVTLSNAQLVYVLMTKSSTTLGNFQFPMVFTGSLSSGATSGTLSGWAGGNGTFTVNFSSNVSVNATGSSAQNLFGYGDADVRTVTVTGTAANWSAGGGGLTQASAPAVIATVVTTSTATASATCGNVGGIANWFSPPHALYMTLVAAAAYPYRVVLKDGVDYGPYVGLPTRRTTTSGTLASLKIDADNFNSVDGYTCYRPDGVMDLNTNGSIYGVSLRNITAFYDSSVATANGGTIFCWRYPASAPYSNLDIANISLYDLNPAPIAMPMLNSGNAGNNNVSIQNVRQFLPDFGTGFPQFYFSGSNIDVDMKIFFTQYSSAQTSRGVYATPSLVPNVNSTFYFKIYGWHQAPVTFTAAITSGATSATMTVAWPYGNGTFLFTFSNNVQRYVTFASSTTTATFTALGSAATTKAVAGNFLGVNYGGWKMRSGVNTANGNFGNKAQVVDVSNNLTMDFDTARCRETWTQQERIVVPTGVTATLHLTIASTMTITDYSIFCVTAAGTSLGLTSVNVGWSGSTSALITGAPITLNSSPITPVAGVSTGGANRTILLTAVGGTGFDGTGEFLVSVTAVQSVITT